MLKRHPSLQPHRAAYAAAVQPARAARKAAEQAAMREIARMLAEQAREV